MNFINDKQEMNVYRCDNCHHNCITYNDGKSFAVNDNFSHIFLENGEIAPCGKELKLRIDDIKYVEYFISSIKAHYPNINIKYNYDEEDDMYWINHDRLMLGNNHQFCSLVGMLIKELHSKGFTNFSFGYSYEHDKELHPEKFE